MTTIGCPTHGVKYLKLMDNDYVCNYVYTGSNGEHHCFYELDKTEKNNFIQYQGEQEMKDKKKEEDIKKGHNEFMEVRKNLIEEVNLPSSEEEKVIKDMSWRVIKSYLTDPIENTVSLNRAKIAILAIQLLLKQDQLKLMATKAIEKM